MISMLNSVEMLFVESSLLMLETIVSVKDVSSGYAWHGFFNIRMGE